METDTDLSAIARAGDEWSLIAGFLPADWQEKARECGAIKRSMRNLSGPDSLLRVLLIHLAGGCSLKETVKRASLAGIADMSHVALHKRLKASGEWFRWMSMELRTALRLDTAEAGRRLLAIDATTVSEPGSTGTDWLVHYSLDLASLRCVEYMLTDYKQGEKLTRFHVQPNDVCICDRGYGTFKSIEHAMSNHAHIIVRIRGTSPKLFDDENGEIELPKLFAGIKPGEIADWKTHMGPSPASRITGRLVCVGRSKEATAAARRRHEVESRRKGQQVSTLSLDLAPYFFLWTSLPVAEVDNATVLTWYRLRWQVELAFKRMKSIMELGHLPKTEHESAHAWIQGKLFVGLLLERIHAEAESFSPWGFPLERPPKRVA
jgi:hypothetical protein